VTATGTAPFTYQWRKDAIDIPGATSATYNITTVLVADAGSYDCVISNACGNATSSAAALAVNNSASVASNPSSQTICSGLPASFSVTVSGTAPITYQWRKDAVDIGGATASTYTIATALAGDTGAYDCVVTNACGSATSSAAALLVQDSPSIGTQPLAQSHPAGSAATFVVAATGTAPLTYQWRKDASNLSNVGSISGATTPSLSISPLGIADAGEYDCVITNPCGTTTSNAATLTITHCPSDLDNGSGTGTLDGGVDINDLLYFINQFQSGALGADLDDGTGSGSPDGGVDVNDLLYFLDHFASGC
jgi:hypothetical protein